MALTAQQVTQNYNNYVASQPKTSTTSSSSAPSGSTGATYRNSSGQLVNSAGEIVGGAVTSGGISYGSGIVPNSQQITEKAGGAIPAENIGAVSKVNLPSAPQYGSNYLAEIMGGLGANPSVTDLTKTEGSTGTDLMDIFKLQAELTPKPESKTDLYAKTFGLSPEQALQKQQAAESRVSSLSSQLAGINAKAQADLLTLRGVGSNEGVTEVVYGGQQATINREAAIKALPVAAELSAAQGDLTRAEKHLDNLFKVQSEDIDADYDYRKGIVDSFVQFATKSEQRKYDAALQEAADRKAEYKDNAKLINDWATAASNGGEPELISTFTSIDPKDPNFKMKLAAAQSKIKSPLVKLELDLKRANLAKTLRETALLGEKTAKELKEDAEKVKQAEARAVALQDKVKTTSAILNSKAIDSVVGTSFISRAQQGVWGRLKQVGATTASGAVAGAATGSAFGGVGAIPGAIIGAAGGLATGLGLATQGVKDELTGDRQALIGSVNQIVNQEFLDSVLELKSQGGTLGQITNIEGEKLQQAATRIGTWELRDSNNKVVGYNVSEAEFIREVETLQTSYNRILAAAQGTVLDSEESAMLENIFTADNKALDPSFYFSN
jgi:hypothetical protein